MTKTEAKKAAAALKSWKATWAEDRDELVGKLLEINPALSKEKLEAVASDKGLIYMWDMIRHMNEVMAFQAANLA